MSIQQEHLKSREPFNIHDSAEVNWYALQTLGFAPTQGRLSRFIGPSKDSAARIDVDNAIRSLHRSLKASSHLPQDEVYTPIVVPQFSGGFSFAGKNSLIERYAHAFGHQVGSLPVQITDRTNGSLNASGHIHNEPVGKAVSVGGANFRILALISKQGHEAQDGLVFSGMTIAEQKQEADNRSFENEFFDKSTAVGVCSPAAYIMAQTVRLLQGQEPLDRETTTNFVGLPLHDSSKGMTVPSGYYSADHGVRVSAATPDASYGDIGCRLVIGQAATSSRQSD